MFSVLLMGADDALRLTEGTSSVMFDEQQVVSQQIPAADVEVPVRLGQYHLK